ncbi:C2H2-like zinc finger protein [Quillaja saponaria]|uniref:C2H2-like zinc finger protein n=1 Tax=Quillaja saponaria TaxID=32244 RepID=A0AAD7LTR1_QUISA|nr:C2H2-like zinc finger protein [Quillaja saponaria]
MAATIATYFNKFLSLLLLILHLGCFIFTSTSTSTSTSTFTSTSSTKGHNPPSRKRKITPLSSPSPSHPKLKPRKALSSSWTFIKHLFSSNSCKPNDTQTTQSTTPPRSSQHSLVSPTQPESHVLDPPRKIPSGYCPESDISAENPFFPLRNDIFPCTVCGEIFQKPQILEQHQAIKHAFSELLDGDTGNNIVRIIFKTGWTDNQKCPKINRILKIHNCPKILAKFEEYRESVKAKAARNVAVRRRDERCIADGNELLRFHCSTFLCDLGLDGNFSLCSQQYCNICGIIKSGFSPKLDGISTLSSSWRAHVTIPEEIEEEFKYMNVKRAMLVCRVIAGRVGCESGEVDKEDGGFDSLMARSGSGVHTRSDDEELLVFNPRAVLPCFVIVYTM